MKNSVEQLAVFGGRPAFENKLYVGRPNIGQREHLLERINDILDQRWLTNNSRHVREFEHRVAELLSVKHCVAVCNATAGLEIAIRALGLAGEVIVPAMTFVATPHALEWQKIMPVFADIDSHSLCIDPRQVEKLITPQTTGIIGVHLFGRVCDAAALQEIAARRGLTLLYDAAHALGCSWQGAMIGGLGAAEVFSFHATKFVNSFEGGAVTTNDGALAAKLRLMRNFGFADVDRVESLGINAKMHEASAVMGLTSLESLEAFVAANHCNYRAYLAGLGGLPGLRLLEYDRQEKNNYQWVVLLVDQEQAGITRDQLLGVLQAENVLARRYYYPGCHRMAPYHSRPQRARLPITERIVEQVVCLPNGTVISTPDVQKICHIIRLLVANAAQLNARLG